MTTWILGKNVYLLSLRFGIGKVGKVWQLAILDDNMIRNLIYEIFTSSIEMTNCRIFKLMNFQIDFYLYLQQEGNEL